jgi:hypothetical protein
MFQLLKSHHQAVKFKDYFKNRYYMCTGLARYGIPYGLHCMLSKIYVKSKVIIRIQVKLE